MSAMLTERPIVRPLCIGPTWTTDEWGNFILPEITLGWEILDWIGENLLSDEGGRFTPTPEQGRFILHWYALDEHGQFLYRDGILQRLKGWGKDPLIALICAVEFLGPCRFAGWRMGDKKDGKFYEKLGDPVGMEHDRAWVQVAAVNIFQTRNTMKIFPGLFSEECKKRHGITKQSLGKETIYAHGGMRSIEAVTSSPKALEGGRTTFTVRNETHLWLENNNGHDMAEVIDRNAAKSKDGAARAMSITNAYMPSQDSVAERQRTAWEKEESGESIKTGVLYDSLECPPEYGFMPPHIEEPTDEEIIEWVETLVDAVRGDATWLDVNRITRSILSGTISADISRRFWLNQIVGSEDGWVDAGAVEAATDPLVRAARARRSENTPTNMLHAGWIVGPDEPIVMFFDGSKSDDSTALVGCRIEDGYTFVIGIWSKPPGERGKGWLAPRDDVNLRVDEAFNTFKIVAFWGDPSHALDDDSSRYWDRYLDSWHRTYKDRLDQRLWAVKTGTSVHSVMWDMTSPDRQKLFAAAAELTKLELEQRADDESYAPSFYHDGHPALKAHLKNCVKAPNPWGGVSVRKEKPDSPKKIDLGVCVIGARMLARLFLNAGDGEKKKGGRVW